MELFPAIDLYEGQAVRLYQQAAERGLARAQYCLGRCCEEGRGVKKDLKRAQALYQQAADGGCQEAREALERVKKSGRRWWQRK